MNWIDQAPDWMREQLAEYARLEQPDPVAWVIVSLAIHEAIEAGRPFSEIEEAA